MPRTVRIIDVLATANRRLRESAGHESEYRRGIMAMIETVLHMSHNYKGFYYLPGADVNGGKPGIHPDTDNQFDNTDPTRINYY